MDGKMGGNGSKWEEGLLTDKDAPHFVNGESADAGAGGVGGCAG